MNFVHIADVHLSAVPESGTELGKIRKREIYQTFYKVLEQCRNEKTDLLLIAGDLFHRPPLIKELKELDYHFQKLSSTQIVLIAGNHDYAGPHSNYRNFQWSSNVTMLLERQLQSVYFPDLNTRVYGFSYHDRNYPEALPDSAAPKSQEEISILMLHGGEEGKVPFNQKRLAAAGFDYIALGHIHSNHEPLAERMTYTGSLEPIDRNELGQHGYYKGSISSHGGRFSLQFVPAACRKYIKLEITVTPDSTNSSIMEECERQISQYGDENLYRILLSGRRSTDLTIDRELLFSLGIVLEVIDDTLLDFDVEQIANDNSDNIFGMFIRKIHTNQDAEEEIKKKALNYGLEALWQTLKN